MSVKTDTVNICALCGKGLRGMAMADGVPLCHPDDEHPTCYILWTVWGKRPADVIRKLREESR